MTYARRDSRIRRYGTSVGSEYYGCELTRKNDYTTQTRFDSAAMRQYIRHLAEVPIELQSAEFDSTDVDTVNDISHGGLSFSSPRRFKVGAVVQMSITVVDPVFKAYARISWCENRGDYYDIGAEFLEVEDSFRARMVEQVCRIEKYRQEQREQHGRELTSTEAATEWIRKFASDFPGAGDR